MAVRLVLKCTLLYRYWLSAAYMRVPQFKRLICCLWKTKCEYDTLFTLIGDRCCLIGSVHLEIYGTRFRVSENQQCQTTIQNELWQTICWKRHWARSLCWLSQYLCFKIENIVWYCIRNLFNHNTKILEPQPSTEMRTQEL